MANQGKSKFQLNKGTDREFDISKGHKHKFDLTKEVDEPEATPETNSDPEPTQGGQGKNKWVWIILAILVVGLLVWWLLPGDGSSSETEGTPVDTTQQTVDSISTPVVPVQPEVTEETGDTDGVNSTSEPATQAEEVQSQPQEQDQVHTQPTTSVTDNVSGDVEAEALKVIRGEYGDGQVRKDKLGNRYEAIQSRVNELKREGVF
jgi:hypothetical protein